METALLLKKISMDIHKDNTVIIFGSTPSVDANPPLQRQKKISERKTNWKGYVAENATNYCKDISSTRKLKGQIKSCILKIFLKLFLVCMNESIKI